MLFYQNTLIDIEAIREYAATQSYDSLKIRLNESLYQLNIVDANDCRVAKNWEEHCLYSNYISIKTIDNIRAGALIVDISFVGLITSYWIDSLKLESEIYCEPKGVDYYDIECGNDVEILHGYDLRRFFFVYYAIQDINIRANILNKLIWELELIDSEDSPDSDIVLEYLIRFRELIKSQPEQILQTYPQEQIYSIPTNLTEEQLRRILKSLKTERFVAPEQTEEDFLNSFEIEGRKPTNQGKINWIKESIRTKKESERIISKTTVFDFVNQVSRSLNDNKEAIEAIFVLKTNPIRLKKDDITTFLNPKRGKSKSEYHTILQNIIEG